MPRWNRRKRALGPGVACAWIEGGAHSASGVRMGIGIQGGVRVLAVAAAVAMGVACTDGGSPEPYGAHCDQLGPDFTLPLDSAVNLGRQGSCDADPECRPQQGLYTFYTEYDPELDFGPGWCHTFLLEYVACIPDVIADPNVCTPGTTGLPGGPTWGSPGGDPDLCYRMQTPCMPEGFTDCQSPAVTTSVMCAP
ncbi:MAG: hypothetical protein R3F61_35780 [Myxococcota bacterium]